MPRRVLAHVRTRARFWRWPRQSARAVVIAALTSTRRDCAIRWGFRFLFAPKYFALFFYFFGVFVRVSAVARRLMAVRHRAKHKIKNRKNEKTETGETPNSQKQKP
jgi:hypothetical protein